MERERGQPKLRDRLAGGRAHGLFVKLGGLEPIDCASLAGFDFAVVDLEHSALDERTVFDQLAYGRALGLPLLVRVGSIEAAFIGRLLEAGAVGIQLADVTRRAEVEQLIAATRFAPGGERGVSNSVRAAGYASMAVAEYVKRAGEPMLVVQIERAATVDPLAELLDPRLDVCFVGALDLSADLGVPGEVTSAAVRERSREIAAAAAAAGLALGQHVGAAFDEDARYVTLGTDATALLAKMRELLPQEAGEP